MQQANRKRTYPETGSHPYSEVVFMKGLRGKTAKITKINGEIILAVLRGWDRYHVFISGDDGKNRMIFKQDISEIAENLKGGGERA